jgi:hypothetical protein
MRTVTRARMMYKTRERSGRLPICKSLFFKNYVYHVGGPEFVPGTKVRRLRPVPLGEKISAFFDDEIDAMIEGLRAEQEAAQLEALAAGEDVRPKQRVPRKVAKAEETISGG